jgi:glc operon protein GlcG
MQKTLPEIIQSFISECGKLIAEYMQLEADRIKNDGNVAICIIDMHGNVWGKIFGSDKLKGRETYNTAWLKASQVHITGMPTGEYEKQVFNETINDKQFGIKRCDFIGFKGGLPFTLNDGTMISVGFSGFRGITDVAIVERAFAAAVGENG